MITLIGIVPGTPDTLTVEAEDAIRRADLLIGASRMLDSLPSHCGREVSAYRPVEKTDGPEA